MVVEKGEIAKPMVKLALGSFLVGILVWKNSVNLALILFSALKHSLPT